MEYFIGSARGAKLREIIEQVPVATSIFAIAELAAKYEREQRSFTAFLDFIQNHSTIIPITIDICLLAAKLKNAIRRQGKFGLGDAIHLATAHHERAVLLTTDMDFRGIENAQVIG